MTLKGFICCVILLALIAPAWAQDGDPIDEHFFAPELVMKYQRKIDLTPEQRETIKTAAQTAQAIFTDIQWHLSDAMETMKELIKENEVDEQRVLDQLETILNLEREIKRAHLTLMVHIKNTLTPEQQLSLKVNRQWDEDANHDGSWPW